VVRRRVGVDGVYDLRHDTVSLTPDCTVKSTYGR
jgi:hypothetical protein